MTKAQFAHLIPMDESHLSTVHSIEQAVYDFPWSFQGFERSLDQGLNYIFCGSEEEVLGYCCVLPVVDEAHILNICVAPRYQRQGIARAALLCLLEKLKSSDFNIALLEVRDSNIAARKLYASLGFNEDGVRKNYYRTKIWDETSNSLLEGKEDAILMSFVFE